MPPMSVHPTAHPARTVGTLLVAAGAFALVGNLLHPRFSGADVDVYRHIAGSTRYAVADLVLLPAFVLLTIGLAALARRDPTSPADAARMITLIGGSIGVAQTVVELQALRQQSKLFVAAPATDRVGAFWSTNSLDRLNGALTGGWVILLLGVAPVLLAARQFAVGTVRREIAALGMAGGVICVVVGVIEVLSQDQGRVNVAFLVGSLLLTAWVLATGATMMRTAT